MASARDLYNREKISAGIKRNHEHGYACVGVAGNVSCCFGVKYGLREGCRMYT